MWVKIDDGLADHPKIERAGPAAAWLYVCGLCYAGRYLTDGHIPRERVARLAAVADPERLAERLVEVGLWIEVEDGYEIHGFLDFNPPREKVEQEREAAKARKGKMRGGSPEVREKFGRTSGELRANFAESSGEVREKFGKSSPSPSRPVPSNEDHDRGSAPRSPKKREPSVEVVAVSQEIALLTGVEYPPAEFDALEKRLRDKDLTPDEALLLVRWAATHQFWGGEVQLNPSTIFRPKHWPGLLAKARAANAPTARNDEPEYHRRLL